MRDPLCESLRVKCGVRTGEATARASASFACVQGTRFYGAETVCLFGASGLKLH